MAEDNKPRDPFSERRMAEIREILAAHNVKPGAMTEAFSFLGASVEQVARDVHRLKGLVFLMLAAMQNNGQFEEPDKVAQLLEAMGFEKSSANPTAKPAGNTDGQ